MIYSLQNVETGSKVAKTLDISVEYFVTEDSIHNSKYIPSSITTKKLVFYFFVIIIIVLYNKM